MQIITQKITKLTEKILANGMDYVVTWKSVGEGVQTKVELIDSDNKQLKVSTGDNFEKCMEEIGAYFEN